MNSVSVLTVNRSSPLPIPGVFSKLVFSSLTVSGPTTYDTKQLTLWREDSQRYGQVSGSQIYSSLADKRLLTNCASLHDLVAIQDRGIIFYDSTFADNAIFGWRSIVENTRGELFVPYLILVRQKTELIQTWRSLRQVFSWKSPALLIKPR